jgi:hypothetical protein
MSLDPGAGAGTWLAVNVTRLQVGAWRAHVVDGALDVVTVDSEVDEESLECALAAKRVKEGSI